MSNLAQNDNSNSQIHSIFIKANRLVVLSFENESRILFSNYYTSEVEIKDFNVWINGKSFFDTPMRNKGEAKQRIIGMERNNDCTANNLFDYKYFSKNCKLIAVHFRKQTEHENADLKQQINPIARLDKRMIMFLLSLKNQKKQLSSQNFHKMLSP